MLKPKRLRNKIIGDSGNRRTSLMVNLSYEKSTDANDSDNNKSDSFKNISGKEEELNKKCDRLKEAILQKTRQIFDNKNDFCLKTATILEQPCSSSSDIAKFNHFKTPKNHEAKENNPGNSQEIENNKTKVNKSPIITSCYDKSDTTILLPKLSSSSNDISLGRPVMSSTLIDDDCQPRTRSRTIKKTKLLLDKKDEQVHEKDEATISKRRTMPKIKNVQTCFIALDRIGKLKTNEASKNLVQVSMDLTEMQNNICCDDETKKENNHDVLRDSDKIVNESSNKTELHSSLVVETSIVPSENCSDNSCQIINNNNSVSVQTSLKEPVAESESSNEIINTSPVLKRQSSLRSQLESRSFKRSKIIEEKINNSNKDLKKPSDTIIKETITEKQNEQNELDDTFKLYDTSPSKNKVRIVDDSSSDYCDDEMSDRDANETHENSTMNKIKKRKLFSQFYAEDIATISPALGCQTPKINKASPRIVKRKRMRRNIAGKIIGTQLLGTQVKSQMEKKITNKNDEVKCKKISKKTQSQDDKKIKKKRKIVSKKIEIKKVIINPELSKIFDNSDIESQKSFSEKSNSQDKRGSMNNFMEKKIIQTKGRNYKIEKIIIVATGLSNRDKEFVKNAVKKIPGAKYETSVTRQTTHVVSTGVRTINLLRGIIRGCWLVNLAWVKKSLENKKWLNSKNFELEHFSKAVEENRKERQILGELYVPELFATCGLIYIDPVTNPPRDTLKELIKIAGGCVIDNLKKAKIIIGPNNTKESWILDSITTGELQLIDSYQKKTKVN
ncbi:hypothetical protein HCN44_000052 [Aphidius gifuensis]|uniref:BRCT domain-containing protein n=1 Tax=Aphidius gifuensis TaxID=684658 RepID=A0A834XRA5_APHGI|nr:uncharacterized protein LOC122855379 [Aphidius gifuensis]KAF7990247.1 hypothetical protein HCN44_000052 [Aphidius gifuensis]